MTALIVGLDTTLLQVALDATWVAHGIPELDISGAYAAQPATGNGVRFDGRLAGSCHILRGGVSIRFGRRSAGMCEQIIVWVSCSADLRFRRCAQRSPVVDS
jgi:hypothetical protein